jgi:hypothetical protein
VPSIVVFVPSLPCEVGNRFSGSSGSEVLGLTWTEYIVAEFVSMSLSRWGRFRHGGSMPLKDRRMPQLMHVLS